MMFSWFCFCREGLPKNVGDSMGNILVVNLPIVQRSLALMPWAVNFLALLTWIWSGVDPGPPDLSVESHSLPCPGTKCSLTLFSMVAQRDQFSSTQHWFKACRGLAEPGLGTAKLIHFSTETSGEHIESWPAGDNSQQFLERFYLGPKW